MASYTTTEVLTAVKEGNWEFLPTLKLCKVDIMGPMPVLIAALDTTREYGIRSGLYVSPAVREGRRVAEAFTMCRNPNEPWMRQPQDVYGSAEVTWKDERIDYQRHFGGDQGRMMFGSSEAAKVWHGSWLLRVWEKSTGLKLPILEEGGSKGASEAEDVQKGSSDGVPPEMSRSPGVKRKAAAITNVESMEGMRKKSPAAVSAVVEAEEAIRSADVHRDTKAKKAELLMEMEEIFRKRMEIDMQEIRVRRALLELEYQAQPRDQVRQLHHTAMASTTTADLLKAVTSADQSFVPTLQTIPKANGSQGINIGTFAKSPEVPIYVFPVLKQGKHVVHAFYIKEVDGMRKERRIERYQMCVKWSDDRLDYTKHFLGDEGLKCFGDPREAEVAHKEWVLEAWKKNTGLEMPGYVVDRGQVPWALVPNKWVAVKAPEEEKVKPEIVQRGGNDGGERIQMLRDVLSHKRVSAKRVREGMVDVESEWSAGEDGVGDYRKGLDLPVRAKAASKRRKTRSALPTKGMDVEHAERAILEGAQLPSALERTSIDLTMDGDEESVLVKVEKEKETPRADHSASGRSAPQMVELDEDEEDLEGQLKEILVEEKKVRLENKLRAFRKRKHMESK
ncbi:hypothetical protein LTR56_016959 [Elasticomyces elasticus]|nr:hypothetical protein LTR56_016959 [Elasticomyces elasticus]KAK3640454.1 hypothetical protein LTR22_017011 [Elasticomyces elasticus]KAK4931167.1 hypothetical protein LTR49_002221 [Elasticomyces elasticus]KAK5767902.1 hypothetical protein LTS12_002058 [Elasticomyces elasticus]